MMGRMIRVLACRVMVIAGVLLLSTVLFSLRSVDHLSPAAHGPAGDGSPEHIASRRARMTSMNSSCSRHNRMECLKDDRCMVQLSNAVDVDTWDGHFDPGLLGDCVQSLSSQSGNSTSSQQLTCVPEVLKISKRPCNVADPLQSNSIERFKCFTSWLFPHWYDWEARDVEVEKSEPHFGTKRDEETGAFEMQNVCLVPHGPLFGWRPRVHRHSLGQWYDGRGELRGAYEDNTGPAFFDEYLSKVNWIEEQPQFVDANVVLVPLTGHSLANVAHMGLRALSINTLIETVFGKEALLSPSTLIVFVVPSTYRRHVDGTFGSLNGFAQYLGALGSGRWAVVMTGSVRNSQASALFAANGEVHAFREALSRKQPRVCFKRVAVWDNCRGSCSESEPKSIPPWEASMHGQRLQRHVAMVRSMRRQIARCVGVHIGGAQRARTAGMKVYFAYRKFSRRAVAWNVYVDLIERFALRNGAVEVVFHDALQTSANELARELLTSDVLVGTHGAHFFLSFLMPPSAVVLELTTPFYTDPSYGQDHSKSVFGVAYAGAEVRANGVYVLPQGHVLGDRKMPQWDISWGIWRRCLHDALAVSTGKKRSFDGPTTALAELSAELLEDPEGQRLRDLAFAHGGDTLGNALVPCVSSTLRPLRLVAHNFTTEASAASVVAILVTVGGACTSASPRAVWSGILSGYISGSVVVAGGEAGELSAARAMLTSRCAETTQPCVRIATTCYPKEARCEDGVLVFQ